MENPTGQKELPIRVFAGNQGGARAVYMFGCTLLLMGLTMPLMALGILPGGSRDTVSAWVAAAVFVPLGYIAFLRSRAISRSMARSLHVYGNHIDVVEWNGKVRTIELRSGVMVVEDRLIAPGQAPVTLMMLDTRVELGELRELLRRLTETG